MALYSKTFNCLSIEILYSCHQPLNYSILKLLLHKNKKNLQLLLNTQYNKFLTIFVVKNNIPKNIPIVQTINITCWIITFKTKLNEVIQVKYIFRKKLNIQKLKNKFTQNNINDNIGSNTYIFRNTQQCDFYIKKRTRKTNKTQHRNKNIYQSGEHIHVNKVTHMHMLKKYKHFRNCYTHCLAR